MGNTLELPNWQILLFIQSFKRIASGKILRQKRCAKVLVTPIALNKRDLGKKLNGSQVEACRSRPGITFSERLAQEILGVLKGDSQALIKKKE